MMQTSVSRCDCCGLPVNLQTGEDCPRCNYPVSLSKEERFLENALSDLHRVAAYAGGKLTVEDLIRRYSARLNYLRQISPTPSTSSAQLQSTANLSQPVVQLAANLPIVPGEVRAEGIPVGQSILPAPLATQNTPRPVFSLSSFLADQTINIVASLGAFLILIGALSFIATTTDLLVSFFVLFGLHALFGIVGLSTYRFRSFRVVAIIYTVIFALLVPLVGFSAYRLVLGHIILLSVPTLVAIAAVYAAIVYCVLAIYQSFKPFGYLGMVSLAVADLAVASSLQSGYWWWASMLMLLAFPALLSAIRVQEHVSFPLRWIFSSPVLILREPIRVLMFAIVAMNIVACIVTTLYALTLHIDSNSALEVRFSILSMTLLLLFWMCFFLWLTRRPQGVFVAAYLFLACVLAFCYAFDLQQGGYVIALTAVALLYHGLNRFAMRLLHSFAKLALHLDILALISVVIVPIISAPLLPLQLLASVYGSLSADSPLRYQVNGETMVGLVAVGIGILLSVSVVFNRTRLQGTLTSQKNYWPWILLLSGFLLNWEYGLVVLSLRVEPDWFFLGLALAIVAVAMGVRLQYGATWADPLDVLALSEILLTFILSLYAGSDRLWELLLFFAALSYSLLLYQRRERVLFLPFLFAVLALPIVFSARPYILLLPAMLLPPASVVVGVLMREKVQVVGSDVPTQSLSRALPTKLVWEWPLVVYGIVCGLILSMHDVLYSTSSVQNWISFPVALEMAVLSFVWYVSAALARVRWWLVLVIGFASGALLIPANPFWVLVGITPVAALLAVGISRMVTRDWATPLYVVALLGGVMAGYAGSVQGHSLAATWVLLAFALLTYSIGVVEDMPLALWIAPVFAIWSVYDSAALLDDLYRPPVIALLCAGIGVAIGFLRFTPLPFFGSFSREKLLSYALPFYATALMAAVLTGIYGVLVGINRPFYGAIPDVLLVYTLVAFGVVVLERRPEALLIPIGFAAWAIAQFSLGLVSLMIAYSLLSIGIFVAQFVWYAVPSTNSLLPAMRLHRIFGLGGQMLVVLAIIEQGGLSINGGQLVHVGAAALLVLALLIFLWSRLQKNMVVRRYCEYGGGLLLALVVSWELLAFGQTRLELLLLTPASFLDIVVAPFLIRNKKLPGHEQIGQMVSILGAALLLLPMLRLSFSESNLLPTLLLTGEALALLVLGVATRMRVFILSGAGLVIVGALRALFLPTLGIPPSLALSVLGLTLLAIATGLSLARHRLQAAWKGWE